MSENTKIEWCDSTFNPVIGCTKISPGCDGCYAAVSTPARAMKINWGAGEARHRTAPSTWAQPLAWNKAHDKFFALHGRRRRVFCASLADVFDNQWDPQWRRDLFDLIELTPNLDWLLLTKRIGNVAEMVRKAKSHDWLQGQRNVRIGATIVNPDEAARDIDKLLALECPNFLSMEPLLGDVDLRDWLAVEPDRGSGWRPKTKFGESPGLDWVIVGGESGPGARPMHPDWARSLRDQCAAAGVPMLFKQWGEWAPRDANDLSTAGCQRLHLNGSFDGQFSASDAFVRKVGKKAAGRLLDGIEHNGFPS